MGSHESGQTATPPPLRNPNPNPNPNPSPSRCPNPNQDNYPSTSEDIVFLNTPGFVTAIWGLISPMIGQQTQSKIRFASAGAGAVDESQPLIPDAR